MGVDLTLLDPFIREAAEALLSKCKTAGHPIKVVQGLRTMEEQAALYAKGRTRPGPIVTKARPGESPHNYGLAFDVAFVQGANLISWTGPWDAVGAMGEALGLWWGGGVHFPKDFKDKPHFEAANWRSLIRRDPNQGAST